MAAHRRPLRASPIAVLAVTLAALFAASSPAAAATPSYPQDAIEAAFLYRFADFVSWPKGALARPAFTIAVLDDESVAADLERILPQGALKGMRVRIRRITGIAQLGDAQILYIGHGHADILARQPALTGRPVLVVTSEPGGLENGSTINFLLVDRHVRFEISLPAARRAGLSISAELLSVAARIERRARR